MKFEIDPNELTIDQRAHVAAFITGWPVNAVRQERIDQLKGLATSARMEQPTEEQRLDSEQKSDMGTTGELREISGAEEAYAIGAAQADNLNAIFGTPDIAKQINQGIADRAEIAVNLNSLIPLDKEGLPWDSRIHSSSKATIADGSWKLRRGVDPADVATVKAQLKELMALPSLNVPKLPEAPIPLTPLTFTDQVHNTGHVDLDPASRIPAPPAPVTVITPAPKSHYLIDTPVSGFSLNIPSNVPAPVTLTDLIGRMSEAIAAGKLSQATITEICAKHGVSEFYLLSNRPDLLPLIDADMEAMGV